MLKITLALLSYAGGIYATSACTGVVNSLSDVPAAVNCSNIILNSFTVPAGQGLVLKLSKGTNVTMNGDIAFGNLSWTGPLFTVSGTSITFDGNGHSFDGGGPFYWDGLGINGGIQKPDPMMKISMSGIFTNVKVINSPGRVYSVSNPAPLVMSNLITDNSQGDFPNPQSNGLPAGHNTDGFDVSANDLTIQNCSVHNQDDCLAVNKGSNIVFEGNSCTGGHGISIGSISSDVTVSGVVISGNTVINNAQAFRIKTKATSTNSTVANITYSGNTAIGMQQFGILIDQSYPATLGVPASGVLVSGVNFVSPMNTISVISGAMQVAVNCGIGSCIGPWDWSSLETVGGSVGPINNFTGITGFVQESCTIPPCVEK